METNYDIVKRNFIITLISSLLVGAAIALGLSAQEKPAKEGTVVGLAGQSVMGVGVGLINTLINYVWGRLLTKETQEKIVFKIFDKFINVAFWITALFTAPLVGKAMLNSNAKYSDLIAAQWIGLGIIGIALGTAGVFAMCYFITVDCFKDGRRATIHPADDIQNFEMIESAPMSRRVAYQVNEPSRSVVFMRDVSGESTLPQQSQVIEQSEYSVVIFGHRSADANDVALQPQIGQVIPIIDEENRASPIAQLSQSRPSSLFFRESRQVSETESSHSSSFSVLGA